MNQAITLRDELIALLPTVAALGLTAAQVSVHKVDVVESYPHASVYITSIDNERISKECRNRELAIAIRLFDTDASDIQAKLINAAAEIETAIYNAGLSVDTYVDGIQLSYSDDSTQQAALTISLTSYFSDNLTT